MGEEEGGNRPFSHRADLHHASPVLLTAKGLFPHLLTPISTHLLPCCQLPITLLPQKLCKRTACSVPLPQSLLTIPYHLRDRMQLFIFSGAHEAPLAPAQLLTIRFVAFPLSTCCAESLLIPFRGHSHAYNIQAPSPLIFPPYLTPSS